MKAAHWITQMESVIDRIDQAVTRADAADIQQATAHLRALLDRTPMIMRSGNDALAQRLREVMQRLESLRLRVIFLTDACGQAAGAMAQTGALRSVPQEIGHA